MNCVQHVQCTSIYCFLLVSTVISGETNIIEVYFPKTCMISMCLYIYELYVSKHTPAHLGSTSSLMLVSSISLNCVRNVQFVWNPCLFV
jgi:hypothetical protein